MQIQTIFSHQVLSGHPSSPPAGFVHIYSLSDGFWQKDSSGTETKLYNVAGGLFPWTEVTGTTQAFAVNNGYIMNNGSQVVGTLPATAAVGDIVQVVGKGAGGWKIAQNSGQIIHVGDTATATGTGGSVESINRYDCIELICIVANTEFNVKPAGNYTITY